MTPEDITKAIDDAIRAHELRVALWSRLLGAMLVAGAGSSQNFRQARRAFLGVPFGFAASGKMVSVSWVGTCHRFLFITQTA